MAGIYTIDASVFVNAFLPHERDHGQSRQLIDRIVAGGWLIVAPTLLLVEIAAALSRATREPELARQLATTVALLPHVSLLPLDRNLADESSAIAAERRLRASDAVYGAVALRFASLLVTRDREQLERLTPLVATRSPTEALAELS
ncbi:MAG: PilT protein domain protein [Chloroflexi bacterium]|nr:PilT protein domain protein [Chloroflexota bacterium]